MLDTRQIMETPSQRIAVIHLTIPRADIRSVMGPGVRELMAAVAAQNIAPTGPWFTHHLRMDQGVFDFEIGVPVTAPVTAVGRMKPSQQPAMRVARTIHHGPYEGLAAAWREFGAWIAANGHTQALDLWECYLVGPEASNDQAAWRTQLNRALIA